VIPGDESAIERAAGGTRALSRDEGKDGGRYGEGIELGEGSDEGSEA
jgi:hypothetical protein